MNLRGGRLAAWLAILAMALNALWPLVAQAKPRSVTLVPVCTIGGETHYQELPAGKTPLEQQSASHQEHCSYCGPALAVVFHASEPMFASPVREPALPGLEISLFKSANPFHGRPRAPPSFLSMGMSSDNDRRDDEKAIALRLRDARAGDGHARRGDLRLGVLHH